MSQPTEVLIGSTTARVLWTAVGLLAAFAAGINIVVWQNAVMGLVLAWGASIFLILGICGRFPAWSHFLMTENFRESTNLLLRKPPNMGPINSYRVIGRILFVVCAAGTAHGYFGTFDAAPFGLLAGVLILGAIDGGRYLLKRKPPRSPPSE